MYISKDVKEFVKKRLYEFYYILKNAMCFSFFLFLVDKHILGNEKES